jgi:hypothetical protein
MVNAQAEAKAAVSPKLSRVAAILPMMILNSSCGIC